jgi:hypothetical protein
VHISEPHNDIFECTGVDLAWKLGKSAFNFLSQGGQAAKAAPPFDFRPVLEKARNFIKTLVFKLLPGEPMN